MLINTEVNNNFDKVKIIKIYEPIFYNLHNMYRDKDCAFGPSLS